MLLWKAEGIFGENVSLIPLHNNHRGPIKSITAFTANVPRCPNGNFLHSRRHEAILVREPWVKFPKRNGTYCENQPKLQCTPADCQSLNASRLRGQYCVHSKEQMCSKAKLRPTCRDAVWNNLLQTWLLFFRPFSTTSTVGYMIYVPALAVQRVFWNKQVMIFPPLMTACSPINWHLTKNTLLLQNLWIFLANLLLSILKYGLLNLCFSKCTALVL